MTYTSLPPSSLSWTSYIIIFFPNISYLPPFLPGHSPPFLSTPSNTLYTCTCPYPWSLCGGVCGHFMRWGTVTYLLPSFLHPNPSFLHQALDIFNTSLVTPVYYVFFTACVILSSAMLFKEWEALLPTDILGVLAGFLVVVIGIFILHAFK